MSWGLTGALRHQLASTSPIRWQGLARAVLAAAGGADPRPALVAVLTREHGVAGALLCGSGTEALLSALEAGERLLGERRPVVLPAYSCFDVAAAAARFGRPVRFYDLDPRTLGPDPESLGAAVRDGAGSVVIAALFGVPIDWDSLDPILTRAEVVVEDVAQGHGARWKGARLGGHGRLGVLSFARGKGWTGGGGGALLVRDASDLELVLGPLPRAGVTAELEIILRAGAHRLLGRPAVYRIPRSVPLLGLGETRFRPAGEPTGMPASAAALLLDSRSTAELEGIERRRNASTYRAGLERLGIRPIEVPAGGEPGYVRFPVLMAGGMAAFSDPQRARALGAAASYPAPLPRLEVMARLEQAAGASWPGASRLATDLVTLPTHGLVLADERGELLELLGAGPRRS
jgi:dTDP-4-amino-4,6-dideoxygalactose transaminase